MAGLKQGRRGIGLAALVVVAVAVLAAMYLGPRLVDRYGDRLFSTSSCTVSLGDNTHTLSAEQANNAALITATSVQRGLPARAATIALATAIQESDLRNLDYGDRDSLGLFQQRPSQGWGTIEQITDPYYASNAFYDALVKVDGWQTLEVTVAAQAVQNSAFPQAYADHEPEARLWASALTGNSGLAAVTCSHADVEPTHGAASVYADRVLADWGNGVSVQVGADTEGNPVVSLDYPSIELRSALASWSVTAAGEFNIADVRWCGTVWTRESAQWATDAALESEVDCGATDVTVTFGRP